MEDYLEDPEGYKIWLELIIQNGKLPYDADYTQEVADQIVSGLRKPGSTRFLDEEPEIGPNCPCICGLDTQRACACWPD